MSKRKIAQTDPIALDTPDEYTGIGGTYIRDPKTGKRSPAPVDEQTKFVTSEDSDNGSEKQ